MSNPSLILPQSPAYGEDYVYAAQVEDGAVPLYNVLPLTFTRASGGTRINKDGLVQNMPYNLLEYSEDFDNGVWVKTNTTVSTNTTSAPIGLANADSLLETSATGDHRLWERPSLIAGQVYSFTMYVKQNGRKRFQIKIFDSSSVQASALFDVSTGTIIATNGTSSIQSVGNGWYRCLISATSPTTSLGYCVLDLATDSFTQSTASDSYTGDPTKGVYIWGAQLNIGSTAQPYLATTDRLNMPRITYPVGGGCGALLLEKQSTNIVTYSEDATQQGLSNMSASANTAISPDGTQNADTITPSAGISDHYLITNATSVSSGVNFTASVFVKKKGYDYLYFGTGGDASFGAVRYQFSTNTFFGIAGPSIYSATNFGNGWVRLIIGGTTGGTDLRILITPSDSTGNRTFDSNGTDGLYVWGLQIEASSYATSYIPTTSTSATRIADACYKTGISNLIGQSEGYIYGQVNGITSAYGALSTIMSVSDGTTQNRVMFSFNPTTGYLTPRIYKAGSTIFVEDYNLGDLTQTIKFAIGWGAGRAVCYVNGTQIKETTGLTFFSSGTLTRLGADQGDGGSIGIGKVSEYILGITNLTNAELQALTT